MAASPVHVLCRVRPDPPHSPPSASAPAVVVRPPATIALPLSNHTFSFDECLPPSCTQADVYAKIGAPLVASAFEGFNCTIFAYGQTGSGKTFTMQGNGDHPGLAPRIIAAMFARIAQSPPSDEFVVTAQFVEIYLEKVRDLLDRAKSNLAIRENADGSVFVEGATSRYASSAEDLLQVLSEGNAKRATAGTLMNDESSRSHSVFTVTLVQRSVVTGTSRQARINLVDLAGSEAVKKSGANGDRLDEANAINSSLTALGKVIYALTDSASTHVPFRDSKLTRMLQESLGGNAKTTLIINCSGLAANVQETLSTLRFGTRAKAIKNRAVVNQIRSVAELEELLAKAEAMIKDQAARIEALSTRKVEQEAHLSPVSASAEDTALAARVAALEEELIATRAELERTRASAHDAHAQADELQADLARTQEALAESQAQANSATALQQEANDALASELALARAELATTTTTAASATPSRTSSMAEQRLEKLVAVHRQLLRKAASLEQQLDETRRQGEERVRALQRLIPAEGPRMVRVIKGQGTSAHPIEPVMLL